MFQKLLVLVIVLGLVMLGLVGDGVWASTDWSSELVGRLTTTVQEVRTSYSIVDTGQELCYDASGEIACPAAGEAFYGQDAQIDGNLPSYTISADGLTVYDNVTGLTWTQSPDWNGDGDIDSSDKFVFSDFLDYPNTLNAQNYGGYSDWRAPTIKELYSLIDFDGTDPAVNGSGTTGLTPFIDTDYFAFGYGDTAAGERIIDAQFWSSTVYVSTTMGGMETTFGVNFADGRIKGYGRSGMGGEMDQYAYFVRGSTDYGVNDFQDNGDGTVTDNATGLMWTQADDGGEGMTWGQALEYCESLDYAGFDDWRLPNAKELQSLVDYDRSPDTTDSAAIDPIFSVTEITNEAGEADYPFYWSSTTHVRAGGTGSAAVYVAFGRGMGSMDGVNVIDVHGAGCQRSDPKGGDPEDYPRWGFAPQGDVQRVFNHARCVHGGATGEVFTGGDVNRLAGSGSMQPGNDTGQAARLPGEPPQEAFLACSGASQGDTCEVATPQGSLTGICMLVEGSPACVPQTGPASGQPPGGSDGMETPPSEQRADGEQDQPPRGADEQAQQPGGPYLDLTSAAAKLGVTEEALRDALGDRSEGRANSAAAANQLGVTEEELVAALGVLPPEGHPAGNAPASGFN